MIQIEEQQLIVLQPRDENWQHYADNTAKKVKKQTSFESGDQISMSQVNVWKVEWIRRKSNALNID